MATHVIPQPMPPRDSPLETHSDIHDFLREAERQESRIDALRIARREDVIKTPIWSDDIEEPELEKNLRIFARLVTGAVGPCERARGAGLSARPNAAWEGLALRIGELKRRIVLPDGMLLTLPLLLGHRFARVLRRPTKLRRKGVVTHHANGSWPYRLGTGRPSCSSSITFPLSSAPLSSTI